MKVNNGTGIRISGTDSQILNGLGNSLACNYDKQPDFRFVGDGSYQNKDTRGVYPYQNSPTSDDGSGSNLSVKSNRGYFDNESFEGVTLRLWFLQVI